MARLAGYVRIHYSGSLSEGLREYVSQAEGVKATSIQPLVLVSPTPDELLGQISPYLREPGMRVDRIELRRAG